MYRGRFARQKRRIWQTALLTINALPSPNEPCNMLPNYQNNIGSMIFIVEHYVDYYPTCVCYPILL